MSQPWPPGSEPDVPDADLGTVKAPGGECAREWPAGPPGADYGQPPDDIDTGSPPGESRSNRR